MRNDKLKRAAITAVISMLMASTSQYASAGAMENVGQKINHVAKKTTNGIKKGVDKAGNGIKKGAHYTEKGVRKGAHHAGKGIGKGIDKTGEALGKAGQKIQGAAGSN